LALVSGLSSPSGEQMTYQNSLNIASFYLFIITRPKPDMMTPLVDLSIPHHAVFSIVQYFMINYGKTRV
jgi:hypothetical protein